MHRMYVYGTIGFDWWAPECVTAADFVRELNGHSPDPVEIHVNSGGGDCFDGSTMYSAIEQYEGEVSVVVDGLAASAASYLIMAADRIAISQAGAIMIHNPWNLAQGDAAEMRHQAELLGRLEAMMASLYASRTGADVQEVARLMEEETWMFGQDAVDAGFADEVFALEAAPAASIPEPIARHYRHVPTDRVAVEDAPGWPVRGRVPARPADAGVGYAGGTVARDGEDRAAGAAGGSRGGRYEAIAGRFYRTGSGNHS